MSTSQTLQTGFHRIPKCSHHTTEPRSKLYSNLQRSFPFKIAPEVPLLLLRNFRHGQAILLSQYVAFVLYATPQRWPELHTYQWRDETDRQHQVIKHRPGNRCAAVAPGHAAHGGRGSHKVTPGHTAHGGQGSHSRDPWTCSPWRPWELRVRITPGSTVPLRSEAS